MKYKDVDWERANCKGLNTDIFYADETRLYEQKMEIQVIRKVCFSCPIRLECLAIALEKDEEGMWGGLTEWERKEVLRGRRDPRFLQTLRRYLQSVGLTLDEAIGA